MQRFRDYFRDYVLAVSQIQFELIMSCFNPSVWFSGQTKGQHFCGG